MEWTVEMEFAGARFYEVVRLAMGKGFTNTSNAGGRASRVAEARRYVFNTEDGAGTFNDLCYTLGIEPSYIRRKVRAVLAGRLKLAQERGIHIAHIVR